MTEPMPMPGDVIASVSTARMLHEPKEWIVAKGIQAEQILTGHSREASMLTHIRTYVGNHWFHIDVPGDRCFSMTWSCGKWEPWSDVRAVVPKYYILRPTYAPMVDEYMLGLKTALWRMWGVHYDELQLAGIILNDIAEPDEAEYHHWIDRGNRYTVCSGCDAAAREQARISMGSTFPRLFGGKHVERVKPADYLESDEFKVVYKSW